MSKETLPAEIAKQIPIKDIYDDVAHPALSEVGSNSRRNTHSISSDYRHGLGI